MMGRGPWASYGLAALLIGGVAHLVSVLLVPRLAGDVAFTRIAALGQGTPLRTVPGPPVTDRAFPYADPAMATAFCVYDLRSGPVRVSLGVKGTAYLALSVHNRRGGVISALTNRSASKGELALLIVAATDDVNMAATGARGEGDLRVTADDPEGFVMAQALADTPSTTPAAEAAVRTLICRSDRP